jgi:hypothetical protein
VLAYVSYVFMVVSFVGYVIILWDAFMTDVSQGYLCLCVPFYFLYYAFARSRHPRRRLLLVLVVGSYCIAMPLQYLAPAQAGSDDSPELTEDPPDARPAGPAGP